MLSNTTLERLQSFKLSGFVDALIQQMQSTQYQELPFEERLSLLVDSEFTRRTDARLKRMLKEARLPHSATLDAVDFNFPRALNKRLFLELAQGNWLAKGTNIILTGPTGVGKTFLGCAIAHSIITRGFSARFHRTHLWIAHFLGCAERCRLPQAIAGLKKVPLLIFDEWLLDQLSQHEARLLLELFDARYQRFSCMFITQLPVPTWHARFADPTLADAILDRLVHNSFRLELQGDTMRKLSAPTLPEGGDTSLRSDNLDKSFLKG